MRDIVIIWGSFFSLGALFSIWESLDPARRVSLRGEILRNLGAFGTVFCFFLLVGGLVHVFQPALIRPELIALIERTGLYATPTWFRLVLFFLVWDCSMYWVHRLMHTPLLWRTHKWHHAPEKIWWIVGVRGSLPHIVITYFPFLWFFFFKLPAPLALVVSVIGVLGNAWMHVNVRYGWMKYLEFFFLTPRFHVIHHSDRPEHYRKNLGSLFTIWDRLFGTYLDPDSIETNNLRFGIGEKVSRLRLAVGV